MGNCSGHFKATTERNVRPEIRIPPAPQVDEQGVPVRDRGPGLSRSTLLAALDLMDQYIVSHGGRALTVIVTGGVLNTIFIQDRDSTPDINFLGAHLTNRQRVLLWNAAHHARVKLGRTVLGQAWFNNDITALLSPQIHWKVTDASLERNRTIFIRKRLGLVAAPWDFACCSKMAQIAAGRNEQSDVLNASSYLHCHIRRHGNQPVSVRTVQEWAKNYHLPTAVRAIEAVRAEYHRQYGKDGIVD